jgi:hypothetical protein
VELDGADEQLDRLLGRVDARLLALLVDTPHGALAGGRLQLGRVALDPAIETWFMAPEVVAAREHPAGFDPDQRLVHQEPALDPRLLDQLLPPGGVPLVDGAVGRQVLQSHS